MENYPDTIQLGSVINVDTTKLPKIDILIGGSPCQSFSFAGKRKGMATKDNIEIHTLEHYLELKAEGYEFEGQSYLFWEYMRILKEVKPKYFLLENVMMGEKWEKVLSKAIGVNPIEINSSLVSAQNRRRLYWTNIGLEPSGLFGDLTSIIKQPKDKGIFLKDILQTGANEKYFLTEKALNYVTNKERLKKGYTSIDGEKGLCLTSKGNANNTGTLITESIKNEKSTTIDSNYYKGFGVRNNKCRQVVEDKYSVTETRYEYFLRRKTQGYVTKITKDNNDKSDCLVSSMYKSMKGFCVYKNNALEYEHEYQKIRRLTPLECERLQTVNDNYTACVSDSQRYRMLGNGWTIDVIAHIFKYIK
jgi:DNA (cytosine-5)-methyltransferase 3A